ncbi:ABC transporter ATP-binding protein [Ilumatobacter coccineus]|uniref:ABC transporter ATP-binding protein n=1 Tax=Ilumatobacter coccineus TaxID=467094 RepID=UPI0018D4DA57|nr:ABC transporter ATP-binding protein [Ilumatobacter coccineus]
MSVDSADVKYRVYEERNYSMRDMVSSGFRRRHSTIVHAVQDVSFDVHIGEAVGIVGSNGSGKSTLLRAVAGLQALESGSIKIRGEAQLLSVSGALKPSLSGYRNVLLGGLAMGLDKSEIEAQMDDIIEFSGLGEAMGRPMKTYSSGMRARLSFSIATLRVPDILLIDEALAVGDKEFRSKSLERVNEIRDQAGTILMVTHNLNEIRDSCTRAIWLEKGVLMADGDVADVLAQYESR